jgi:membrane-associated phospholipid phosphatase
MIRLQKILLMVIFFTVKISSAQNIDINILKSINPRSPDASVWKNASNSVYWVSCAATFGSIAYGYIFRNKEIKDNGFELLVASAINISTSSLCKVVFNRTRPAEKYPEEIFVNEPSSGKSFPSGHTSQAFAIATTLTLEYKKWYVVVPAYLWAGCVGYSRMYLGKHYPSDVLAGAVVGAGSSYLSHMICNKFFRNKNSKK